MHTKSLEIVTNSDNWPLLFQYHILLRADTDTFPSPTLRDDWPSALQVGATAGYQTDYARVWIGKMAEHLNVTYLGHDNLASTIYGPTNLVVRVMRLTLALAAYMRPFFFGDGAACTLPVQLRPSGIKCEWGSGLYEGVMALYTTEMAINHVTSQGPEFVHFVKKLRWDVPVSNTVDLCQTKLYHAYHDSERFFKFAFAAGKYKEFDLRGLKIREARDYATFVALRANGQGLHGDEAEVEMRRQLGIGPNDGLLRDLCPTDGGTD